MDEPQPPQTAPIYPSVVSAIPSLDEEMRQLAALTDLEADWDTYGAARISDETIARVKALIVQVAARHHMRPDNIFSLNSGAVQVDAHAPFHYLHVEGHGIHRQAVEESAATFDAVLQAAAEVAHS